MVERKEVTSLKDVLQQLQLHTAYGIIIPAPYISYGGEAIQVITAHKSKGLEYEVVFLPGAVDSTWGAKKSRSLFKLPILRYDTQQLDLAVEDERRLFYVAMTRAKTKLTFTLSDQGISGKDQLPSRFLSYPAKADLTNIDTSSFVGAFSPVDTFVGLVPEPDMLQLVKFALEKRGLSPTALNNYLENPWDYFFKNVLRVPQIKATELQYGTAVHAVLDDLVSYHIEKNCDEWLSLCRSSKISIRQRSPLA